MVKATGNCFQWLFAVGEYPILSWARNLLLNTSLLNPSLLVTNPVVKFCLMLEVIFPGSALIHLISAIFLGNRNLWLNTLQLLLLIVY